MEPPSPYSIPILNDSNERVAVAPIRRAIRAALGRHGMKPGSISVLLATDERQRELNRTYRGIDETTDVLTFPASPIPKSSRRTRELGDISIAIPTARRQANERGTDLTTEICHLAIHGALHLCGFDDETPEERREMQIAMAQIAECIGIEADSEWSSLLHAVVEDRV